MVCYPKMVCMSGRAVGVTWTMSSTQIRTWVTCEEVGTYLEMEKQRMGPTLAQSSA
jgi:hypothetical protein